MVQAEYFLFFKGGVSYCVNHSEEVLRFLESYFSLKFKTHEIPTRIINVIPHKIYSFILNGKHQNLCKDCSFAELKF